MLSRTAEAGTYMGKHVRGRLIRAARCSGAPGRYSATFMGDNPRRPGLCFREVGTAEETLITAISGHVAGGKEEEDDGNWPNDRSRDQNTSVGRLGVHWMIGRRKSTKMTRN